MHLIQGRKMTGKEAYEEDCRRKPCYDNGGKRKEWDELCPIFQRQWNEKPVPRNWNNKLKQD